MLFYYASSGLVRAAVRDKNCATVSYKMGYYALNEDIKYSILMNGYDLTITTDKMTTMTPYKWSWMNTTVPVYFKHGLYV